MSLFTNEIIFDYPAPKIARIIKEIENISGLPVIMVDPYVKNTEVDDEELEEDEEELHEFIQHIAFKYFPKSWIEISAYIPNAVNKSVEKEKLETGFDANWPQPCHGADEQEGKQSIYMKSYLGLEPTLYLATIKALESLGGIGRYEKNSDDVHKYFPVTVENLSKRHKKNKRKIYLTYVLFVLMLPITITIGLIKLIISIIKMPFEINRSMKAIKKHYPEHFKDK